MRSTIMRHTDAGKLRIGAQRRGLWSVSLLTGLILVAISASPTWAKLSNATGTIEGRAPTATGTLSVMFPESTTAVTDNAVVSATMKPSDFWVSAATLTLHDLDGDTGLSSSIDTAAVTWAWKYNGVALTPAQLTAPFSTSFLGKSLTVSVSAPVTVSSLTGVPTQSSPVTFNSAAYTVVVPAPPVVQVNGTSFAFNAGFPKTGFSQAQFQFWMDGTSDSGNSNYTFAADPLAPWVTVNSTTGVVTFTGIPAAAQTVTITITNTITGLITPYSFTLDTWFINNGANIKNWSNARDYCAALPGQYVITNHTKISDNSSNRIANGRIWNEWGRLDESSYPNSRWLSGQYWAAPTETITGEAYSLSTINGYISLRDINTQYYTSCSRTL